jgi:hypothetical protein
VIRRQEIHGVRRLYAERPTDPIIAFQDSSIGSASGSQATIAGATLTVTGARTVARQLTLDFPNIVLAGEPALNINARPAADAPPGDVCGELCGGAMPALDLALDTASGRLDAHVEMPFSCAF